jgi:hypothetical protein
MKTNEKKPSTKKTTSPSRTLKQTDLPTYDGKPNPFEPKAWAWVSKRQWENTPPPICYMPPKLVIQIREKLGKPLTLELVKLMVRAEGDPQECTAFLKIDEKHVFFPVTYAFLLNLEGEERIASNKKLTEDCFWTGGNFFIEKNVARVVSGCPYHFNGERYVRNDRSPMVELSIKMGSYRKPLWGKPYSEIQKIIDGKTRRTALSGALEQMAQTYDGAHRRR